MTKQDFPNQDFPICNWPEAFCSKCGCLLRWIDAPLIFSPCMNRDCIKCPDYSPTKKEIDSGDSPE